ncbi:MAG: hypothetical protein WB615_10995 [Candidatus Tumulicola sp.]
MKTLLAAVFVAGFALTASPAPAQQAGLPTLHHLVYQFGYNTPATKSGTGTGTTTIDIVGLAPDGGMTVKATDDWWNTVRPRQTYTCEVYSNGGVTCAQPPNAISPIQLAVVPLLGQHYFSALSAGANSTWQQKYNVHATFAPSATSGFAGQVYTWNGAYTLTGKGMVPNNNHQVNVIHSTGAMKQHGGRYVTVNQKANLLFDPKLGIPVYVDEEFTFVPRITVNRYTVQMKLISFSKNAS